MRVMVTGSRTWTDREKIREALATIGADHVVLMHGAAPGADKMAADIAEFEHPEWDVVPYPAEWTAPCERACSRDHRRQNGNMGGLSYCPDAGTRRNQEMVNMLDPGNAVVLAFPTKRSVGTWDAVRRARKAGIEVVIVHGN